MNLAVLALLTAAISGAPAAPHYGHHLYVQGANTVFRLARDGSVEWKAPCPWVSHDMALLANGDVLVQTGAATITEINPAGAQTWQYTSTPKPGYHGDVEIHAFQPLAGGVTMVAESGNARIIEIDHAGTILRSIPLRVDHPNSHRDTRRVRKIANGHYLVCHELDGCVREYDGSGNVVWSYALDLHGQPAVDGHDGHGINVFNALRLRNGDTLIGGGNNNRVFEVTPAGETVWSIERDELPGIHLDWITSLQVLPNGNVIFGNTHAGPGNPQLIEVTRDKKVVWRLDRYDLVGNDCCCAIVLDAGRNVIR